MGRVARADIFVQIFQEYFSRACSLFRPYML